MEREGKGEGEVARYGSPPSTGHTFSYVSEAQGRDLPDKARVEDAPEVSPKVSIRQDGVFLVRNGKERKLRSAQTVTVLYDEGDTDVRMCRVTFWEPGFDGTIQVSESMAAALLSADGQRQLAFLSEDDARALRGILSHNVFATSEKYNRAGLALKKIIDLLDKRDEIPF